MVTYEQIGMAIVGLGVIGAILNRVGILNFSKPSSNGHQALKEKVKALSEGVRFTDTCEKMHNGINNRLDKHDNKFGELSSRISLLQDGVSTLLERTKNM